MLGNNDGVVKTVVLPKLGLMTLTRKDYRLSCNGFFTAQTHRTLAGQGRTFRRKVAKYWQIWPLPPIIEQSHHVIYVDGLHLGSNLVVLIARSEKHVLGWHVARAERACSWEALLSRIKAPNVVVTDGGSGFEKARKKQWPNTRVQRCTFHVFSQIKRYTTTKSRLLPGRELYHLSIELLHVKSLAQAET
nr:transposase [Arcanobacterium phocae]